MGVWPAHVSVPPPEFMMLIEARRNLWIHETRVSDVCDLNAIAGNQTWPCGRALSDITTLSFLQPYNPNL